MHKRAWKPLIKTVVGSVYYYSGLFSLHLWLRRCFGEHLLVLALHRVVPADSEVIREHLSLRCIVLSSENFAELLKFVKSHFKIVPLADCEERDRQDLLNSTRCLITYDDGYRDFIVHSWPVVRAEGIPVTVFVPTALLGTAHSFWWDRMYRAAMTICREKANGIDGYEGELLQRISQAPVSERPALVYPLINFLQHWTPEDIDRLIEKIGAPDPSLLEEANLLLTWDDVVELHHGGVAFGSHTRNHPNLKLLSRDQMEAEIASSKRDLEAALKAPVQSFAYPGGHRSKEMEEILSKSGYTVAFGTERGFNTADHDLLWLRRINVWDGMLQNHKGRFSPSAFAFNLMTAK